MLLLHDKEQQ